MTEKRKVKLIEAQKQKAAGPKAVVPIPQEKMADALMKHPKVTERQAELVALLVQEGCSVPQACEAMGADRSWGWKTLQKQHVLDFSQDLARSVLGAHALRALATAGKLLDSKSEYLRAEVARDLMDRAGFRVHGPTKDAPGVQVNISFD